MIGKKFVILATVAVLTLGGCTAIERETGLKKETQLGAVLGAATGGLIAGVAGGGAGWIALSTILGGVAGGVIAEVLTEEDKQQAQTAGAYALENQGPGEKTTWENPDSGHSGATAVESTYTDSNGRQCKTFTQTVVVDGKPEEGEGTACRQADGTWTIVAS